MAEAPSDQPQPRSSLLSALGEEIVRIVAPVTACMFLVVVLQTILADTSPDLSALSSYINPSSSSSSSSDNLWTAVITSLVFIAILTAVSFLLVLLFYFRFTRFLKSYMIFSSFVVLLFMGGQISLFLIHHFLIPIDFLTFSVALFNMSAVGAVAVFRGPGVPFVVTQGYLVIIAVLVAYWFTLLPEWTSWALLVSLALYDIAAVLLPGGPLRLLVELAISRDEELPALVYEARPVTVAPTRNNRLWRQVNSQSNSNSVSLDSVVIPVPEEARRVVLQSQSPLGLVASSSSSSSSSQLTTPLLNDRPEGYIGLASSGAIKLGLGDFIFYSVLVGRVAAYDFMAVYACYLAIVAGLGITLLLLAFYQKALPALPVSIGLGLLFYIFTRTLLEVFVVQCSVSLLMF